MSEYSNDWLTSGRGRSPRVAWSFSTDGPLTGFSQSRETGESLVADAAGGLTLVDRTGRIVALSRGFHHPAHVAWSDAGLGAVAVDGSRLCVVDGKLKEIWKVDFATEILGVAVTPHGGHVAAALADSTVAVHDRNANRVARFTKSRPVHHLEFVVARPEILVAADYGFVARHRLDGDQTWEEAVLSNTGDLTTTGDGERLLVAAFNRGILVYGGGGQARATFAIEGTPFRVSMSYEPKVVAAATVEGHLYWMTFEGQLRWGAEVPEDVATLVTSPLGDGLTVAFESGRVTKLTWGL